MLIVVDGKVVFIKAVVDLVEEQCLSPETQPVFCLYTSNKKHFLFFTFWWSLKAFLYCHMLYPSFKLYLEINKVAFHIVLTFMSAVFKITNIRKSHLSERSHVDDLNTPLIDVSFTVLCLQTLPFSRTEEGLLSLLRTMYTTIVSIILHQSLIFFLVVYIGCQRR